MAISPNQANHGSRTLSPDCPHKKTVWRANRPFSLGLWEVQTRSVAEVCGWLIGSAHYTNGGRDGPINGNQCWDGFGADQPRSDRTSGLTAPPWERREHCRKLSFSRLSSHQSLSLNSAPFLKAQASPTSKLNSIYLTSIDRRGELR